MRLKNALYICLLSTVLLSACGKQEHDYPKSTEADHQEGILILEEKKVEKNPSVSLPVDYYVGEMFGGEETKTLTSVEWIENTETNQIIYDRAYNHKESTDLTDYRLLKLSVYREDTNPHQDGTELNITEKWDFVLGEESQREIFWELDSQLKSLNRKLFLSIDITDSKTDDNEEYIIAVPKAIANNSSLQLKILKENQLTNSFEFVYVDLN